MTGSVPRLASMVMLLLVLVLMYDRSRTPETWRWLARGDNSSATDAQSPEAALLPSEPVKETIVPGPTDLDPEEAEEAKRQFEAVSDRSPVSATDMGAYWRCLKWARAQSFADLNRRAREDVFYTQLWEQPGKYRGKLLRLRMHVRRVLDYEAPENSAGITRVYEAWGSTDESRSHPYVVLMSELPDGMKTGAKVRQDVVFVGYFLKTMSYTAADTTRVAPLLAGRMVHNTAPRTTTGPTPTSDRAWWMLGWGLAAALVLITAATTLPRLFRRPKTAAAADGAMPSDHAALAEWARTQGEPHSADRGNEDHELR